MKRVIRLCSAILIVLTDDIFEEGSYVLRELKWSFEYGKKIIAIFEKGFDHRFSDHGMKEVRLLMNIAAVEWHHTALKCTYEKVLEAVDC